MQFFNKRTVVSVVVLAAIAMVCAQLYYMGSYTQIPHSMKLVDCTTNNAVYVHLLCPKGCNFYLLVSTPSAYSISGRIHILENASQIEDAPIEARQVSWLSNTAYILTDFRNATNNTAWNQVVHPKKEYDLQIIFDRPLPDSTSIWLYWLRSVKDKN